MKETRELRKALLISSICIFTYLISYCLRNVLSIFTPGMMETGLFDETSIAMLSSVYTLVYAGGQLVIGLIGDLVRPKYMVLAGLSLAAVGMGVFPTVDVYGVRLVCFGLLGFGLSMLRGPLVKTISENTLPQYARVACVFLSFVSFLGPFIIGLFVFWFKWEAAFYVSAGMSLGMAIIGYVLLSLLEKSGMVQPREATRTARGHFDLLGVFKVERFVPYLSIGMIVEITATSIMFWIPTYVQQELLFPEKQAGLIFSAISFVRALAPFLCLLLFKIVGENDAKIMRGGFAVAAVCYGAMLFVTNPWGDLVLLVLALTSATVAGATIWSIYIPSLAKSGKVSSANGMMDCSGYVGASVATSLFAWVMKSFKWRGMVIAWVITMGVGVFLTFLIRQKKPAEDAPQIEE